jgi:hypothetical protein
MATQTTITTAATTTVQPSTPPTATATNTQTTTTASQRIVGNLQTTMQRAPGQPRGSGGSGNPGGPGGPRGPGGPAPAAAAPAAPAAAPAGNADDRLMGSLPQPFEGDRKFARNFLNQITHYFQANSWVLGLNSAIRKVSIALTLF